MMIIVYVTTANQLEAENIATHLLQEQLIACANIFPVSSLFMWQGNLTKEGECVLIAKTIESLYEAVVHKVKAVHSYQVPCIVRISIGANKEYEQYVISQVKSV